ncbi:hypothetical protein RUMGNA_03311 [Mediterraneibacter gnavus ATCC 29149]|uniref:Uncharacterized protein n=1 Tax=Mediterraneibacter gnavus (strain ATCC 29149 / DSM 114966 / JCM 6515 / VPI C7-9) TaxID=411470 RepID=A7B6U7_MEDG7|nr:hypothetical protein RUMGNA_03311 [Mediterraneibacter gnavus ATCC 29149]
MYLVQHSRNLVFVVLVRKNDGGCSPWRKSGWHSPFSVL